jgi:hypothetical protein
MRLQWEGLPVASGYRVDSIVVREGQELASQIPLSGNLPVLELRLSCAYGGEANSPCLGITLI